MGVTLGSLAGITILCGCLGLGSAYWQTLKERKEARERERICQSQTASQPLTRNMQTRPNAPTTQAQPSSNPEQPPAYNPQFAFPARNPAQDVVQSQATYPSQFPYPAQEPFPVQGQAPSAYPNQQKGGVHPHQTLPPYPVSVDEGGTTPPPPCNPKLRQLPPPSYREVMTESNPPYP